jgi:glucose-1-phosphate cytidylyltransferase
MYWEKEPLSHFLKNKKLYAFEHQGFWKSLDTQKDKNDFNEMIKKNKKPWLI